MLRDPRAVVVIVLLGVLIGCWAIISLVGPPQPTVGLRLAFLRGREPVERVPRLEPFNACDIYCYEATLEQTRIAIEEELGDLFTYRSARYDGVSWAAARDGSGLQIDVYPRKHREDGHPDFEPSDTWVTVYVYYLGDKTAHTVDFDPQLIVGKWAFNDGDEVVTKKELVFEDSGTYTWTTFEPRREREVIASGTYTVNDGQLILQQSRDVVRSPAGEKISEDFPAQRIVVRWRDRDSFQMVSSFADETHWVRVKD